MRNRYWTFMTTKKFDLLYFEMCFKVSVNVNRVFKIIMALASCSSIAAWAIWEEYAFVWGLIIAISQVIGTIFTFLPFQKRIDNIYNVEKECTKIYDNIEKNWYEVSNGKIKDNKINDLIYQFTDEWNAVIDKNFTDEYIPHYKIIRSIITKKNLEYFKHTFGDDDNNE